jgi:hypothetical protein
VTSVTALFALRFYAAWNFTHVRTPWDDDFFRGEASNKAIGQTTFETARDVVLPHGGLFMDGRLNGYIDWLAVAKRVERPLGLGSTEIAFQTMNSIMLLLQTIGVLLFARWALRDRALAWAVAFLYTAAPIVFGTSRWDHTENLVLLAGIALSGLTAWLLERSPGQGRYARLALVATTCLVGWGIGVCLKAREYAAPTFMVLLACTIGVLLLRRRWLESAILTQIIGAFLVPWLPAFVDAMKVMLSKGDQSNYFHPMTEWIPHVWFYSIGPSLTLVLIVLVAVVVYQRAGGLFRHFPGSAFRFVQRELSGSRPLVWGHLFLLLFYVAALVWSRNRVTRPAVPIMLVALGLVLVGIRTLPSLCERLQRTTVKMIALVLIAGSWSVLVYQLWFAFDGGKTYGHHGSRLEYFNYPLHIRPLTSPSDNHVCLDVCPYDKR